MRINKIVDKRVITRFKTKFVATNSKSCWNYLAGKSPTGYGMFKYKGRNHPAQRIAYAIFIGPVPANQFVCHKCDNPSCVNPKHLWLGFPSENTQDMYDKKRFPKKHGTLSHFNKYPEILIRLIRRLKGVYGCRELGRLFNISHQHISDIQNHKTWTHI